MMNNPNPNLAVLLAAAEAVENMETASNENETTQAEQPATDTQSVDNMETASNENETSQAEQPATGSQSVENMDTSETSTVTIPAHAEDPSAPTDEDAEVERIYQGVIKLTSLNINSMAEQSGAQGPNEAAEQSPAAVTLSDSVPRPVAPTGWESIKVPKSAPFFKQPELIFNDIAKLVAKYHVTRKTKAAATARINKTGAAPSARINQAAAAANMENQRLRKLLTKMSASLQMPESGSTTSIDKSQPQDSQPLASGEQLPENLAKDIFDTVFSDLRKDAPDPRMFTELPDQAPEDDATSTKLNTKIDEILRAATLNTRVASLEGRKRNQTSQGWRSEVVVDNIMEMGPFNGLPSDNQESQTELTCIYDLVVSTGLVVDELEKEYMKLQCHSPHAPSCSIWVMIKQVNSMLEILKQVSITRETSHASAERAEVIRLSNNGMELPVNDTPEERAQRLKRTMAENLAKFECRSIRSAEIELGVFEQFRELHALECRCFTALAPEMVQEVHGRADKHKISAKTIVHRTLATVRAVRTQGRAAMKLKVVFNYYAFRSKEFAATAAQLKTFQTDQKYLEEKISVFSEFLTYLTPNPCDADLGPATYPGAIQESHDDREAVAAALDKAKRTLRRVRRGIQTRAHESGSDGEAESRAPMGIEPQPGPSGHRQGAVPNITARARQMPTTERERDRMLREEARSRKRRDPT